MQTPEQRCEVWEMSLTVLTTRHKQTFLLPHDPLLPQASGTTGAVGAAEPQLDVEVFFAELNRWLAAMQDFNVQAMKEVLNYLAAATSEPSSQVRPRGPSWHHAGERELWAGIPAVAWGGVEWGGCHAGAPC